MIIEGAFQKAMGDEVRDMPHDYDSLADWARGFIERYVDAIAAMPLPQHA